MAALLLAGTILAPPSTPREPVVDEYFGTKVTDPFRWMEERQSPRFLKWLKEQDAYARATLARIPGRDALRERIAAKSAAGAVVRNVRLAGGRTFFLKREAGENHFSLFVREADGAERRLLDPEGSTIGDYAPSQDGKFVAYVVSAPGTEESVLHVMDAGSGRRTGETIDRTAYADPSWLPDGKAFYYNRLAKLGPEAKATDTYLGSRVFRHVVGSDPAADPAVTIPDVAPADFPYVRTTPGSPYLLATVYRGVDAAFALFIARGDAEAPQWRRVAGFDDAVVGATLHGRELFLLTRRNAPRGQILSVDADAPDLTRAKTIVPASARVIQGIAAASDALYLSDLDGGLGKIRRYAFASGAIDDVALPLTGSVTGPVTDPARPGAVLAMQNWITPQVWHRLSASGTLQRLELAETRTAVDPSKYQVEELHARSWDGTPIPLSVVRRRDTKLDGSSPAWLLAYGAYGISLTPSYGGLWGTARLSPFLEDGGIYAVCHARGGGEHGEEWHRAGKQTAKPNTHKDLIACAEHLIAKGYARRSALAIEGSSAGGLAAGMATVTRPDLFRVVFNRVGDNNALRLEHAADGPAIASEFGSTKTLAGFRTLLSVDPTQHVRPRVAYPAVFLTAGFNDARVPPWQPAKLAAHLQGATNSGRPVLFRVDFEGGHGPHSRAQADAEHADMLAFFYWQIGRTDYQPAGD